MGIVVALDFGDMDAFLPKMISCKYIYPQKNFIEIYTVIIHT